MSDDLQAEQLADCRREIRRLQAELKAAREHWPDRGERVEWLCLLAEFLRVTSRLGEPCMLCHRDGATDDDHGEGCEWVRAREILDENGYDTDALTGGGQSG